MIYVVSRTTMQPMQPYIILYIILYEVA